MSYSVVVPANPDEDQLFEFTADYPAYWYLHSDYNDGYRATEAMWEWFRDHSIEVTEWDIVYREPTLVDERGAAEFRFEHIKHALLFKLTWL